MGKNRRRKGKEEERERDFVFLACKEGIKGLVKQVFSRYFSSEKEKKWVLPGVHKPVA